MFLLNGTVGELTPVGTILAEDDGIALVGKALLHHIKLFTDIGLFAPRTIILSPSTGWHMDAV